MDNDGVKIPKLSNISFRDKVISIIVLAGFFVTIWFMLDLAILTFILTFIFYYALKMTKRAVSRTPLSRLPDGVLLICVFIVGIALLALSTIAFVPILIDQTSDIANSFIGFNFDDILANFDPKIASLAKGIDIDLNSYFDKVGNMMLTGLLNIGKLSLNILLAMAVSFILLLEKGKIHKFGELLYHSRIAFIYHYFMVFGVNFCRTFGKVMKVQITIAFVNSGLSILILGLLGFRSIIWGLGVMIFLLGLIPVAGVIISLVPLTIIAFNIGGFTKVIEVLIMVVVIHAVEAYILNPKLMANRTRLPVSFVFIILLVAEKYIGVWGLLIGVPLFIFLMTIFGVKYEEIDKRDENVPLLRERLRARIRKLRRKQ
jgi:predicted PurR-regulated permease PerM